MTMFGVECKHLEDITLCTATRQRCGETAGVLLSPAQGRYDAAILWARGIEAIPSHAIGLPLAAPG